MTTCKVCDYGVKRPWLVVNCPKCNYDCCRDCFQQYLLHSSLTATCMNCSGAFSDDFVMRNTTAFWRSNNYKIHRENRLFEAEQARLPETQDAAIAYRSARIQIVAMSRLLREEKKELYKLYKSPADHKETIRTISERITEQKRILKDLQRLLLYWGDSARANAGSDNSVVAPFIRGCPSDLCRGFLNADYRCGLCDKTYCNQCMINTDGGDHMCDQAVVASVAAINREAKPCPSCATLISKIDGCDQMWCTRCHTTFSWQTGLREEGITHNPHYYEWMRQSGQELPRTDEVCDLPLVSQVQGAFGPEVLESIRTLSSSALRSAGANKSLPRRQQLLAALLWIHQRVVHTEHVVNQGLDLAEPDNLDLRVRYLLNETTAAAFKDRVQKRDKAYRKNLARSQVYTMTYTVASDLYRAFVANPTLPSGNKAVKGLINLLEYSNKCLSNIDRLYGARSYRYVPPLLEK